MKVIVLVAVLCAVAFAQVPTVQQSLAAFDQNGGVLTVYGTGFIQRNLDQFTYNLVTGNTLCPATAPCKFVCHYRTMVVNPAGTITYCEVPYFPDNTLGPAGSNYITLSVNNANGATVNPVTVATIRAVVSDVIPSTSNPIPPAPWGITINGAGFPSENSLFTQSGTGSVYTLTLTDNTNPITIDLLASRTGGLTAAPLAYWDYGANQPRSTICRYTKTQIDCYYITPVMTPFVVNNNINGVFASLLITQAFAGVTYTALTPEHTDRIGPVQIGIVQVPVAPSVTAVPTAAPYSPASFLSRSDQFLTIAGANFLQYPVANGNIFVPKLDGANQAYIRCDPVAVTSSSFTCSLTARPNPIYGVDIAGGGKALLANIGATLPAAVIYGTVFVTKTLSSTANQAVAITNSAGNTVATFKYPLNPATLLPDPTQSPIPQSIVPNDQPIQQDALTISFSSTGASFLVPDINYLYEYALKATSPPAGFPVSASAPANINPVVQLTNLNGIGGAPINCYSVFPDQVEPNSVALNPFTTKASVIGAVPQSTPATDVCQIVSITPSKVTIKVPQTITSPVGTVVSANLIYTSGKVTNAGVFTGNQAELTLATTAIGIVAPGAGVGGDPHFFGFLGEKYEFAGEAGRVYNLLTDEGIQLNAEIGYWHWNRGKETIIRKLALKTNDHRVLIDAGGNNLGTEGFSISVDGASIAPSRIRQTYLGSEGWIRWYPLTADDKFRLPLWERHQGVALIDIFLNDYKFQVLAVEEGKDKDGVWHKQPSRFLDFMAEMLTDRRPHGLFGQSAHLRAGQRSVKDFTIEGEGQDYEVSNLFGDDFAFNKFSAK